MGKALTIYDVKRIMLDEGCECLDSIYFPKVKVNYLATCGHTHKIIMHHFREGHGRICPSCVRLSHSKSLKLSGNDIRKYLEKEGCTYVSHEHLKSECKIKMTYIAQCGHTETTIKDSFDRGFGRTCKECTIESRRLNHKKSIEESPYEKLDPKQNIKNTHDRFFAFDEDGYIVKINIERHIIGSETPTRFMKNQYIEHNIIKYLKTLGLEFLRIVDDSKTPSRYKVEYISLCGHKKITALKKLQDGQGLYCKTCARTEAGKKKKLTFEEVSDRLYKENCVLKEMWRKDGFVYIKYIGTCGHEIQSSLNSFANSKYKKCRKCTAKDSAGYYCKSVARKNPEWKEKLAYVYLVKMYSNEEDFYKIGITVNSTKERLKGRIAEYDFEEIAIHPTNLYDAIEIEDLLHSRNAEHSYIPNSFFEGYTECFCSLTDSTYEFFVKGVD